MRLELWGSSPEVTKESLGFAKAGELAEIRSVAGDQILVRVHTARMSKLGRNVSLKRSPFALKADLPAPACQEVAREARSST